MFICLSSQTVFGISGFDGWWCNIQRGIVVACNQEHVVLGNMFDGLLEDFQTTLRGLLVFHAT